MRLSESHEVESEIHTLMRCSLYDDIRTELFDNVTNQIPEFLNLSEEEKFVSLMNDDRIAKYTAKACHALLYKRRLNMYI